jgi:Icc-related predicted phosphoesterase
MIIDCIGCLHGYYPKLEGGDLLIITGDLTKGDRSKEYEDFNTWLLGQEYKKKIVIAGNHDNFLMKKETAKLVCMGAEYLCDSGTEFEGLKIWGSPWIAQFPGINPKCCAFTVRKFDHTDEILDEYWKNIPENIDILITHGPPYGILDGISNEDGSDFHAGSASLRNIVLSNLRMPKLKFHIFSHIHEQGGKIFESTLTKFVNCSIMNEKYKPVNKPVRIIL